MGTSGITACVSDSFGNILFFSDGIKVWDRTNSIMPNGNGLLGIMGSSQPVFVVPSIPNDSTFFIFTIGNQGVWPPPYHGLHNSKVDLKLNGGYGAIDPSIKNIPVSVGKRGDPIIFHRHSFVCELAYDLSI